MTKIRRYLTDLGYLTVKIFVSVNQKDTVYFLYSLALACLLSLLKLSSSYIHKILCLIDTVPYVSQVLVRDIWVFEKSLFHTGAYWRLCGKIVL